MVRLFLFQEKLLSGWLFDENVLSLFSESGVPGTCIIESQFCKATMLAFSTLYEYPFCWSPLLTNTERHPPALGEFTQMRNALHGIAA